MLLFPHLIAGPIVRHNELVPQFDQDPRRQGLWMRIGIGLVIFTVGFGKKVLLADRFAPESTALFAKPTTATLSFGEAWSAVLGFSFQLFFDFSAYTEMAIGSALIFGLLLPENFRRPYLATDLRDFWRRWHISLSTFLRDYLYIPLGGSRAGPWRYVMATMVTMGLCGFGMAPAGPLSPGDCGMASGWSLPRLAATRPADAGFVGLGDDHAVCIGGLGDVPGDHVRTARLDRDVDGGRQWIRRRAAAAKADGGCSVRGRAYPLGV